MAVISLITLYRIFLFINPWLKRRLQGRRFPYKKEILLAEFWLTLHCWLLLSGSVQALSQQRVLADMDNMCRWSVFEDYICFWTFGVDTVKSGRKAVSEKVDIFREPQSEFGRTYIEGILVVSEKIISPAAFLEVSHCFDSALQGL